MNHQKRSFTSRFGAFLREALHLWATSNTAAMNTAVYWRV